MHYNHADISPALTPGVAMSNPRPQLVQTDVSRDAIERKLDALVDVHNRQAEELKKISDALTGANGWGAFIARHAGKLTIGLLLWLFTTIVAIHLDDLVKFLLG
jgi:hypothetical protein